VRIQGLYAAIACRDIERAEEFYTALFDRGPDDRPMANLIQWRDIASANVQVFRHEQNAGSSMCTIVVPDMEEAKAALAEAGIELLEIRQGDYGKIAHVDDPDGNRLTIAEPPSKPGAG